MATAKEWKDKGNGLVKEKKYKEALDCYTKAIEIDPSDPILYSNRSAMHLNLAEYDQAITDAEKAISLKPDYAKAYLRKGKALEGQQRLQEALDTYKLGLEKDKTNAQLLEASQELEASINNPFLKNYPKLFTDPRTASLMQDPQFRNLIDYAMKDQKILMQMIQIDPRFMTVFSVLTFDTGKKSVTLDDCFENEIDNIEGCVNLKDIDLSSFDSKNKRLFAHFNYEVLIKIYENTALENKEKILTLILDGLIDIIKIQYHFEILRKEVFNIGFKNICENLVEVILFNSQIDSNLISIIDIFLGSLNICSKLFSKFGKNDSLLNKENTEKYILILEKLIDIYKEKKLDIVLYFIEILNKDFIKKNEYIVLTILKLFYKISQKNKYILKALVGENIINTLLNYLTEYNQEIRDIIYNLLLYIIKNINNNYNCDLNEKEIEDIYFGLEINNIKSIIKKPIPLIFDEKPELFKIFIIIINTGDNYDKNFLNELIDILFTKYMDNPHKIYFLIDIISSLIQINDENALDRYQTLMGFPNLIIIPIPKENKNNQKWPLFGERLINGDINQEIYEYIIGDINKNNRCLLSILFPRKYHLDKKIIIKEEQKREILLSFIKCIYNKNNYPLFKYLYTMPSRSLKYKNLYDEIFSFLDIYNEPNPFINLETMKEKEMQLKLQVEKEINNSIKKAFEKDNKKNREDNNDKIDKEIINDNKHKYNIDGNDDEDIIFKYKDKNIKYFNGFIGEIIPGEIIKEKIYGIAKSNDKFCIYKIHYITKYYQLDELREKILNKSQNNNFNDKEVIEEKDNEIPNDTKKYDISEITEDSIIYNIYRDGEIHNYIIEDKSIKDKRKVKNTLVRFVFTSKNTEPKFFSANINNYITKNEIKLNCFCPELIKDYVERNSITNFLNLQRLRAELDFIQKNEITVSLSIKNY